MSKISELALKMYISIQKHRGRGLDVFTGYHEPEMQQYLRSWCVTLCDTFSIPSFQYCVGPDEPLYAADGVGARPARSSAVQTQTTRSWRHEAGSSCRGGELVGTWTCLFQFVQGAFTVPAGQKKVSLSQSSFHFFSPEMVVMIFYNITCFFVHRRMLSLIQSHIPMAKEKPLLLISWLSLVAFEDIPEFSHLTGIHAEHLIQSLMYRLRACGDTRDNNRAQENIKVQYSHLE